MKALVDRLRACPPARRAAILATLTAEERAALLWAWREFWARPDARAPGSALGTGQLAPPGDWMWWVNQGGRGVGKSFAAMLWTLYEGHRLGQGCVFVLMSQTIEKARKDLVEGKEGLLAHAPAWMGLDFHPSIGEGRVTWKSGAEGWLFGGDNKGKGRGPNFNRWWVDDPGAFGSNGKAVFEALYPAFRKITPDGSGSRGVVTTTPPPGDPPMTCPELAAFFCDPQFDPEQRDFVYSIGASDLNFANMNPSLQRILARYKGSPYEQAERGGVYDPQGGAKVFRDVRFDAAPVRGAVAPTSFKRITIAIDPNKSSSTSPCEVGLIAAAATDDGQFWLLEDASGQHTAETWPGVAHDLYDRWAPLSRFTRFVLEVNIGTKDNALLRSAESLRQVRRDPHSAGIPVRECYLVTARQEKGARAAPLPLFYASGRVHHHGDLTVAEDQLKRLDNTGAGKNDRADAAVYALLDVIGILEPGDAIVMRETPVQAGAFGAPAMESIAVGPPRERVMASAPVVASAHGFVGSATFGGGTWG